MASDIAGLAPHAIWRRGVGRTFQVAATFGSMTVAENVQMALISHNGEIYRLWRRPRRCSARRALDLLAQVGMREEADRPSRDLAYGDVKRVELAIALANEPRLLLMDEPTAGMAREGAQRADRAGQAAGGRRKHLRAVHRAFHGCRIRLRRPHHRAGARQADRRRRRRRDPRQRRTCAKSISAPGRLSRGARVMSERRCSRSRTRAPGTARARILYDLSFDGRPRRSGGADGPQRRRQVDDAEGDHGPDRPRASGNVHFTATTSRARSRTRSRAAASAICRKTGASFPISRSWKISKSAASRRAASPTARRRRVDAGKAVRAVPQSRRACRDRPGRPNERRRAADAHGGAHADGQSAAHPAGRAVGRRGAADRRADGRHDRRIEERMAFRSCCPSRTCISRVWSPTASMYWRRARSAGRARWHNSIPTRTCKEPI